MLSPVERALLLRPLPLFEGLTTRQLMNVAELVHEETFARDAFVVREGEFSDCLYIIVAGVVAITKGETVLTRLGPGDFLGEIAIFEGATRSASAVACEGDVRALRLEGEDLLRLMEELPGIAICICQSLSRRVRDLSDRV